MKMKPAITRVTLAAGIVSLVGPACAILPYTDYVVFLPTSSLTVWLLAGIGAIGVGIGHADASTVVYQVLGKCK